jgi:hypothetical protein
LAGREGGGMTGVTHETITAIEEMTMRIEGVSCSSM